MVRHVRRNLIAYLALFVALGGTSYAVTRLPRNSVGSRQIKNHAVTKAKLAKGLKVRGAAGPAGSAGPPGPPGITGPVGPQGPGARRLTYSASPSSDPTPPVTTLATVDGYVYQASCGLQPSQPLFAILSVDSPAGTTFSLTGLFRGQDNDTGTVSDTPADSTGLADTVIENRPAALGHVARAYSTLYLSGPQVTHVLMFRMTADNKPGDPAHCAIEGVVVPAS